MLQFFLDILRHAMRGCAPSGRAECEQWRADPLSHPALRRMDQVELGDLPIGHPVLPPRIVGGCC